MRSGPGPAWRRLPFLVRFMLAHALVGFGLSALVVGALLWWDLGGLGTLLARAGGHPWPTLLLWFFLGLTLGSVQMGVAFMLETGGGDDDRPGGGKKEVRLPSLLRAATVATAGHRGSRRSARC